MKLLDFRKDICFADVNRTANVSWISFELNRLGDGTFWISFYWKGKPIHFWYRFQSPFKVVSF